MTPKPSQSAQALQFEPEFLAALKHVTEEYVSFNKVLGLKLESADATTAMASMEMKPDLVGHPAINRIHGGAISAALDAVGGVAVMAALGAKHMAEPWQQRVERFGRIGTIDLRVDYMRPGIGQRFVVRAEVLRLGSRVATTRMEFLRETGELLSAGMAAYIVS
ncbi:thioesterase family protein [Comamonas kerstersii]|uniref:thioesterase family protein n=1 Tax=Comamonas kerstersii TaxID=225992 RepID=UPI0026DB8B73|nr:thioesterase family protein [Comamonas kerstersii]